MATTETDVENGPLNETAFARDLLNAIDQWDGENPPCGLDIKDELEAAYGSEINHGRLYPNLDDLTEKELVKKDHKDRRTNAYTLTARGERELTAHREWWGAE